MRTLLVLCSFALTLSADQLVLKNGDRVTGSIIAKDAKSVTIKSDLFGVITAPWDQVDSITADKPLTVVLKGGKSVQGTVATADGKVEVATAGTKVAVALAEVEAMRDADEEKKYERFLHPSLAQLWMANGAVGFAGSAGNAKTQTFTTGFTASRTTRTDKISLNFGTIVASAVVNNTSSDTAEAVRGGIAYDHNVGKTKRLFVSGFNNYEYDRFQGLDLRAVFGGGFGAHVLKTPRSSLDVLGGGSYNHESFFELSRKSGEFFWGDDYTFALSRTISLVQAYRMFDNLTDTGQYRVNFDLALSAKVTRWLSWNSSASDRFLSNPVGGRKRNDFLYTIGLGVTFAPQ
jgi:putative salt-induced outer membrane protein YdiY